MPIKVKIALLIGGSVTAVLLLLLLIFNIGIHHQIDDRARQAIEASLSDSLSQDTSYLAEWIYLPEEENDVLDPMYLSKTDQMIIDWCEDHKTVDGIQCREIGNGQYYLKKVSFQDDEFGNYSYIAYVNVAGELQTIRHMNLLFLLAALVTGLIGSLLGYRVGTRLEENEAAQKMFFENASHELKTPLTVIQGYAEGIEKGVIKDHKETGEAITAQVKKMSNLVENILLLSKLESQDQPLRKESLRIDEFLVDCLMPLEEIIAAKEINLKLDLAPACILADPERLDCAVTNLLTNAIRYTRGNISIHCDAQHLLIWNDCDPVPQGDIDHLFDRFHTGSKGSTGIGLALAKEIVLQHGFQIQARNEHEGLTIEIKY